MVLHDAVADRKQTNRGRFATGNEQLQYRLQLARELSEIVLTENRWAAPLRAASSTRRCSLKIIIKHSPKWVDVRP